MKITGVGFTEKKIRIENTDDLWVLARVISKGMNIGMLGERRDPSTADTGGGRAKVAERKKMYIRLNVENIEYLEFSDDLRVHGVISEAKFDIGSHHTHILNIRDEVSLISESGFSKIDVDLLNEAVNSAQKEQIALLVVETDEIIHFAITPRGILEKGTWTMRGGGKRGDIKSSSSVAESFRKQVGAELNDSLGQETVVVIAGPGHAKDRLGSHLKETFGMKIAKIIPTSMGGRGSANEVLRDGLAGNILSDFAIIKETELLQMAWKSLATDGKIAYGTNMLSRALSEGAIETLLINADLIRSDEKIDEKYWRDWVKELEQIGAEIVQCSSEHDDGKQLIGMGGAVALLRYSLEG